MYFQETIAQTSTLYFEANLEQVAAWVGSHHPSMYSGLVSLWSSRTWLKVFDVMELEEKSSNIGTGVVEVPS
jgi:hypothetical protein